MARELITSWIDYQSAAERLLTLACRKVSIYDEDLCRLKLESPACLGQLQRILKEGSEDSIRIALRNTSQFHQRNPGLLNLLTVFGHRAAAQQTPEHLAHLRDSMIIVDGKHALVRFDRDQARSKLLIDEADELRPYIARFDEIWSAGGESVRATLLGL